LAQKQNRNFYAKSILEYGISAQGVHWNSSFTQYKRFEILTQFITQDIHNSSIIDVGCGMGEYYNYLMNESLKPKTYQGIDCEESMIGISKKRYPRAHFEIQNVLSDPLFKADYYVCSGAMNILEKNEFYSFIENCYQSCTKGFAFNFLKKDRYTDITKEEIVSFCKNLTPNIQTKDNYLDNDYSIFLQKEKHVL